MEGVTPFPPEFAALYRAKGYWLDRPLGDHLREWMAAHADRTAICHPVNWTYAELDARANRLARHLLGLGIGPRSRVVMHLPNVPEFIELYLALEYVGATPLMALPAHREHEIGHYVEFIEAEAYAVPASFGRFDFIGFASKIKAGSSHLKHVLVAGEAPHEPGFVSIGELAESEPDLPREALDELDVDPDDPCVFQLSGGTTGIPKVIPRSHNDYAFNSHLIGSVNDIGPDDVLLVAAPIGHNFPLASPGIQAFFEWGGSVALTTSPKASAVLPLIEQVGVTHLEIVPAMVIGWLNDPLISEHDLSSVRVINSGGQKYQRETKLRTEAAFPRAKVQEVFGMAEGLLMIARLDDPDDVRYETAGRPICPDDEVLLVDDDGEPVPDGEVGELICRGPYTLRGYYNVPEVNARSFTGDGFYLSGDLLRLHPSGNYVVEGRKKDLVNRGGEKISAEEIEDILLSHEAVLMVSCVPMPDPVLGERMCAYVVPQRDRTPSLADLTGLLVDRGVARFKHPERLEIVDQLPLSPFGKVQKNVLAARIAEKVAVEEAATSRQAAKSS
jgi:2,3-dihydroxybenzoate-AMP ligase